jgi:(Z)-2-((N-methylformamido)methylene)-5-hydroxybutyrolactone dehydrogenase
MTNVSAAQSREKQTYKVFIDGKWSDADGGAVFDSEDPFSGDNWASVPHCTANDAAGAVEAAYRAFDRGPWPTLTATARGQMLYKLADLIQDNAEHLAGIEVRDNGKLMVEMLAQVRYTAQWYRYFGGLADKIEGAVLPIDKPDVLNFTRREPLGVVVVIVPWNSPLLLMSWKVAPALAAGNTVVVKPSEYTSCSTLEFARLIEQAGFPPGVFNVVTGFGAEVGEALTTHPKIAKVAFTGGDSSGRKVYQAAASRLKPVVMELGGKSPNIVFDDCDIDNAVKGAVSGIFAASGQTCIAGSRLLLQETIYDKFLERLVQFAGTAKLGDPRLPTTQVGPVTTRPQHKKVLDYIAIAKGEGAKVALGGAPTEVEGSRSGLFVQPTIFAGVNNRMRIAQEEVFGPVLSVISFKDEDDAIAIANDTLYGLAAGVWTNNMRRAINVSNRVRAGTVWVNTYRAVSFMSPFGGYKDSGFGRENGQHAIDEYLQTKSVWINTALDVPNPFSIR